MVGGQDAILLLGEWGQGGAGGSQGAIKLGDLDGDGVVGPQDLVILLANLGINAEGMGLFDLEQAVEMMQNAGTYGGPLHLGLPPCAFRVPGCTWHGNTGPGEGVAPPGEGEEGGGGPPGPGPGGGCPECPPCPDCPPPPPPTLPACGEQQTDDRLIPVTITVGDPSGSRSERWALRVGGEYVAAEAPGEVVTRVLMLRKDQVHPVWLEHLGSTMSPPDYDWVAEITAEGAVIEDPCQILGKWSDRDYPSLGFPECLAHLRFHWLNATVDSNNDGYLDGSDDDHENDPGFSALILADRGDLDADGEVAFSDVTRLMVA